MPSTVEGDPLAGWRLAQAPFYRPVAGEVRAFEAAAAARLPVLLTGPTGCGKTRFVEHMAWRLGRPLVTLACHEDLTAGDLAGRWLLDADGTRWQDGPLALAARHGAICYLDELVEARSDALVVIHPLADSRRVLPLERRGELLQAHPDFLLVASYNPGYRGLHKALKPSTRQRFTTLAFGYPDPDTETAIVAGESGVDPLLAGRLVALGLRTRRLQADGLEEGASTRLLVHAARLVQAGLPARAACLQAVAAPLADDPDLQAVLADLVHAAFE
ncbi:CbbQ/NirQ/NorQ/GpvN family protein [Ramlibacter pallidus]|uniref:CbbQ/NirQ/NorQ/GpvN family protein n=1 Tax=Ramlibacter pallidus TaxID=2780087 RepID=A0ABR9S2A2_9BURK|nr:CbbQ/NirQ/NorQ/GpvN family protein [Ramlibacter pallidus]MBE7367646.1 CbbQ/NirQ/NorQ/GpvN family protein [Ramlibacter pallidus]